MRGHAQFEASITWQYWSDYLSNCPNGQIAFFCFNCKQLTKTYRPGKRHTNTDAL